MNIYKERVNTKLPCEILKWERVIPPKENMHTQIWKRQERKNRKDAIDLQNKYTFYGGWTEGAGAVSWMAMEGEQEEDHHMVRTVLKRKST